MATTQQSIETIYVGLKARNIEGWRPVQALRRADGTYEIISQNDDPEDEDWQFQSGSIVHCELRQLADGIQKVAVASVAPRSLKLVWPASK